MFCNLAQRTLEITIAGLYIRGKNQEKVLYSVYIKKGKKEKKKREISGFAGEKLGEKLFINIDMLKN